MIRIDEVYMQPKHVPVCCGMKYWIEIYSIRILDMLTMINHSVDVELRISRFRIRMASQAIHGVWLGSGKIFFVKESRYDHT